MKVEPYALERQVWTDSEFEQMGWHDSKIHAVAVISENFELLLDLDYILEWVDPVLPDSHFSFIIAPATLIFHHVWSLEMQLSSELDLFSLYDIEREDKKLTPNGKMLSWQWTLNGDSGYIRFRAIGFTQQLRRRPLLTHAPFLTYAERGGLSFDRGPIVE